jgi:hypothetical protein
MRDRYRWPPLLLAALAAGPVASCADDPPDTVDDAACQTLLDDPESLDAFDWLNRASPLPKRPGSMTPEGALALAYRLDALGAVRVVAVGMKRVKSGPEPRDESRGVVVTLPADPAKRLGLFRLYEKQTRSAGYAPRADRGQKYLFVPWTPNPSTRDAVGGRVMGGPDFSRGISRDYQEINAPTEVGATDHRAGRSTSEVVLLRRS